VPLTAEPITEGRPFLAGSPGQIASDIRRIEDPVDQVYFANGDNADIATQIELLEGLSLAVNG
jgi:hypothetical protein